MLRKTDTSYGIIPLRQTSSGYEVLLIEQHSRINDNTYWVFPKGHPESGEQPQATATRELAEETGLVPAAFIDAPPFVLEYTFRFAGDLIDKRVEFYLARIEETEPVIDGDGVVAAAWLPLAEAEKRLDYQNTRTMFAAAKQYIEENL